MLERLPLLSAGISLRPLLACEISPAGVLAARPEGDILVSQFVALPAGCLAPGTKPGNVLDRPRVVAAVRSAINVVAERGRNLPGGRSLPANRALTMIVPDASVRVLLLDFDTLPSTLAASTLIGAEAALLVNRNGNTLTTAIVRGEELLLHRALEFELEQDGEGAGDGRAGLPAARRSALDQDAYMESLRADDIRQTVSVAMAYYEDTLAAVPSSLYYIGPGTVGEFEALLGEGLLAPRTPGETQMLVRELLPVSGAESLSVPRALLAPVAGALVNG